MLDPAHSSGEAMTTKPRQSQIAHHRALLARCAALTPLKRR